jgi:hypothetical protein
MPRALAKIGAVITPKRRWAQFSLGTMLLVVAAICIWLADYVRPVRRLERQLLRDPDTVERVIAAQRLGYMGSDARSTTKSLLCAMKTDSSDLRRKSVWALSRVSGRPEPLLPFLAHSDDTVKLAAAEGVIWSGGDPLQVFWALDRRVTNGSVTSKVSLCAPLGPNEAAAVIPFLLDTLGSSDASRQKEAADCLQWLSVPALTAIPAITERLDHSQAIVRKAAAEQLLLLPASARSAAPALRARLHDPDRGVAAAMAAALGAVDPDNKDFLSVLQHSLRSGDVQLVSDVALYLFRLGPAATEAADDLVTGICDPSVCEAPHYGHISIWAPALKQLGLPAVSAVDRRVRQALDAAKRLQALPEVRREQLEKLGRALTSILRSALAQVHGKKRPPQQNSWVNFGSGRAPRV